jgi:uncharacterized protein (DUF4415 family)
MNKTDIMPALPNAADNPVYPPDPSQEEIDELYGPDKLPDDFWDNGVMEFREGKEHISIRLPHYVLDYFKSDGPGYQSRITDVLRYYVIHQMMRRAEAKGRQEAEADVRIDSKSQAV